MSRLKRIVFKSLCYLGVDSFFRNLNGDKLLIVTYHSVCTRETCPQLFTHLPVDIFEWQLTFLKKKYNIISLNELIDLYDKNEQFPTRAALITFDDGFMNNYTVAYPVLKKMKVPTTIFLTMDYIGASKLLWFDELFLVIKQGLDSGLDIKIIENVFSQSNLPTDLSAIYPILSSTLKRQSMGARLSKIAMLKREFTPSDDPIRENFRLLTWEQIQEMKASGLVDFGVHTATHQILSGLDKKDFEKEIVAPKKVLSHALDCEISSFCYPNGTPKLDYFEEHEKYLEQVGYRYIFSSGEQLHPWENSPLCLERFTIGSGSDVFTENYYFRLNISGAINVFKKFLNKE